MNSKRLQTMLTGSESLTHGELFAGISGFGKGFAEAGIETLWHVEKDTDCQKVLRRHYPDSLLFSDIRQVGKHNLPYVDIVSMGFPCQGLSVAGKRAGLADDRSGLFFEGLRVIYELQPIYAIWEKVPGLLTSCSCRKCRRRCARCGTVAGADDSACDVCGHNEFRGRVLPEHRGADFFTVVSSFGFIGFDGAWTLFDSQYFGVPQRRRRLFGVFTQRHLGAGGCAEILSFLTRSGGNPPPSRKKGQGFAAAITERTRDAGRTLEMSEDLAYTLTDNSSGGQPHSKLIAVDARNGATDKDVTHTLQAKKGGYSLNTQPFSQSGGNGNIPSSRGENLVVGSLTAHHGRNNPDNQHFVVGSLQAHSKRHGHAMGTQQAAEEGHMVVANTFNGYTGGADDNDAQSNHLVVALAWQQGVSENDRSYPVRAGDYAGSISETRVDAVAGSFGIRRLTPVECERLQGFPDNWTLWGLDDQGGRIELSDSARYRQLGNAVTVKVTRWIGGRVENWRKSRNVL
jgi:DNA (cytosine-5)-methyltransferase 1